MLKGHKWLRWYGRPMISLPGFRMMRSDERIHSLGCFHIGGVAYGVWALPPNTGGTAHRHVQVHIPTAFAITMSKQLLLK